MENRPVSVATSNGTSTFVYDGDGKRVKKIEGGQTTIYINKFFEKSGSDNTTYYYLGGKMVAMQKGTNLSYVYQDHLTGTAVTDNGAVETTTNRKRAGVSLPALFHENVTGITVRLYLHRDSS